MVGGGLCSGSVCQENGSCHRELVNAVLIVDALAGCEPSALRGLVFESLVGATIGTLRRLVLFADRPRKVALILLDVWTPAVMGYGYGVTALFVQGFRLQMVCVSEGIDGYASDFHEAASHPGWTGRR